MKAKKIVVEMTKVKIRRWNWAEHIPRGKDVNNCFTSFGVDPKGSEGERKTKDWKGWEVAKR